MNIVFNSAFSTSFHYLRSLIFSADCRIVVEEKDDLTTYCSFWFEGILLVSSFMLFDFIEYFYNSDVSGYFRDNWKRVYNVDPLLWRDEELLQWPADLLISVWHDVHHHHYNGLQSYQRWGGGESVRNDFTFLFENFKTFIFNLQNSNGLLTRRVPCLPYCSRSVCIQLTTSSSLRRYFSPSSSLMKGKWECSVLILYDDIVVYVHTSFKY